MIGDISYGVPDPDNDEEIRDERKVKLNQLQASGRGDRWYSGIMHSMPVSSR
jgi:hypothetical protein